MIVSIHNTNDRENRTIGETILETLASKGMKQSELCDFTGIPKPLLNDVIKGRRNLTAEMAVLIESALGLSADWLLTIQIRDELDKAYNDSKVVHQLQCMSDWELMKTHVSVPVLKKVDMYKPGVTDKVETIMAMFRVKDINDFLEITKEESIQTYFKRSEKLNIDNVALFTWKHYCYFVASQKKNESALQS